MFDWIKFGILLLQFANKLVDWGRQQRDIQEGEAIALQEVAKEVLRKSGVSREILDWASSRVGGDLDDELRKLEPREGAGS
jgi:hypothetical protein